MMNRRKKKPITGSMGSKVIRSGSQLVIQDMGRVIDTYQPASYNLGYQVWEYEPTPTTWEIPYFSWEYTATSGYIITP